MNVFQELVDRYTAFYRPKKKKRKTSARGAVKPLKIAAAVLLHPDNLNLSDEELKIAISGEIAKLMQQVRRGTAEGFAVSTNEIADIAEFSRFFVDVFFNETCYARRDLLTGNKFALVEHSCEWLVNQSN